MWSPPSSVPLAWLWRQASLFQHWLFPWAHARTKMLEAGVRWDSRSSTCFHLGFWKQDKLTGQVKTIIGWWNGILGSHFRGTRLRPCSSDSNDGSLDKSWHYGPSDHSCTSCSLPQFFRSLNLSVVYLSDGRTDWILCLWFLILQISSIRVLGWVTEPNLLGYLVLGGFPPKIIVTGLLLTEGLGSQDLLEKSPTALPKDQ